MKTVCLIMAGGKGERFWPKSRNHLPKQFLCIDNSNDTLIQKTVKRISPLVDIEDIYILTNENYASIVKEQLPGIPHENIVCEPMGRNTAPAIGLGVEVLRHKYDDCVMMILPSDHFIFNEKEYLRLLNEAIDYAHKNEALVTLGINPTGPNTGYGYIKLSNQINSCLYQVDSFKEKPNLETAKEYVQSGQYVWNAGMFIWKLSTIDNALKEHMPTQHKQLKEHFGKDSFIETFKNLESISIDFGVMEKANNIYVVKGDFGWDDVGSWEALHRVSEKDENNNALLTNNVVLHDSHNCVISSDTNKLIATVGLDNIVVVETKDSILIANKDRVGEIKEIIKHLKEEKREEYL